MGTSRGGNRRCRTASRRPIVRITPQKRGSAGASEGNMTAWGRDSLGRSTWAYPCLQVEAHSNTRPQAACVLDPGSTYGGRLSALLLRRR